MMTASWRSVKLLGSRLGTAEDLNARMSAANSAFSTISWKRHSLQSRLTMVQYLIIPIYTYKRVVCVCWFVCLFVCLLFIGHTTFVHFVALPPSGRESRSRRRGRPRAPRGQPCTSRARARMPYNFSTKKSLR